MGNTASTIRDLTPEQQHKLYQQLKKSYDEAVLGGKWSPSKNVSFEEYVMWKDRLETMILGLSQPLPSTDKSVHNITINPEEKHRELLRYTDNENHLSIGDVVKVLEGNEWSPEGLIVEIIGGKIAQVDFGDSIIQYPLESCKLVLSGTDFELHDLVQVKPQGMSLYFTGVVMNVNEDGTLDVKMDGDDPDDIERNCPKDRIVKLNSCRPLALGHWRKLKHVVTATTILRTYSDYYY